MTQQKIPLGTAGEAEAAFYDALGRGDINALMVVWADEEDIVCIHPGAARLVGRAAIRESWEGIFERGGGVPIIPLQLHATHNATTAVHNLIEEVYRPEGSRQALHIVATNIYIKTPLGWRMVLHHASIAPGLMRTEKMAAATLH